MSSADCWIGSSLEWCQVPLQQLRYLLSFLAVLNQSGDGAQGSSDLSHPSAREVSLCCFAPTEVWVSLAGILDCLHVLHCQVTGTEGDKIHRHWNTFF